MSMSYITEDDKIHFQLANKIRMRWKLYQADTQYKYVTGLTQFLTQDDNPEEIKYHEGNTACTGTPRKNRSPALSWP